MNSSAGLPNVVRELDKGTIFRRTLLRTFERADRDIAVSRVKSQEHVRQSSIEKSQWAMDLLARARNPEPRHNFRTNKSKTVRLSEFRASEHSAVSSPREGP
jgi:hypothetical protein